MATEIKCPHCNKVVNRTDDYRGKDIVCDFCKKLIPGEK